MLKPQPSHTTKPSTDEPWRYVCPSCENQVTSSGGGWWCYQCETVVDELKDLKTDAIGPRVHQ